MRKILFPIGLLAASILGCVNRSTTLTNPNTGDQVYCDYQGWGWMGAPMAASGHNRCLDNWEARGYAVGAVSNKNMATATEQKVARETVVIEQAVGHGWTLRKAKEKYKADELSRSQYEAIRGDLKRTYREKVSQLKSDYRRGLISKEQYKGKVQEAKYEYEG